MNIEKELEEKGYLKTPRICPECKTKNIYFRIKYWAGTFICLNCGERGFSMSELLEQGIKDNKIK